MTGVMIGFVSPLSHPRSPSDRPPVDSRSSAVLAAEHTLVPPTTARAVTARASATRPQQQPSTTCSTESCAGASTSRDAAATLQCVSRTAELPPGM